MSLDFNIVLMIYILNKDNDVICFISNYSSIQLCIDADLDHFIVKK